MEVTLLQRPVSWRYGSPSGTDPQSAKCLHGHRLCWPILDGAIALLSSDALQRLVTGNTRDGRPSMLHGSRIYLSHVPRVLATIVKVELRLGSCARRWRAVSKYRRTFAWAALAIISVMTGGTAPRFECRTERRNCEIGLFMAGYYPTEPEAEATLREVRAHRLGGRQTV